MSPETLTLRVRSLTWEAEGILGIELVPGQPGQVLPPTTPGAHVELRLPKGLARSYSLIETGEALSRWRLGVNRDAASRGGSRWLHDELRPGQWLEVGAPRNLFPLEEAAPLSVLIAGGIGITPLLAMAGRLSALGRPWVLHQAARSRAHAPFQDRLRALAARPGGAWHLHCDDEAGAVLDVAGIVAALPADAHVYACGPLPMLAAFEAATAAWSRERVHLEYFAAKEAPASAGGFTVRLHRSGRTVAVAPGQTILGALQACGLDPLHSCAAGICGTCSVAVLAGTPDHRDMVLSEAERAEGRQMMICVSGALTPELEIDL